MQNILITTLGASWQIVPELVGWTNPDDYDFFKNNEKVKSLRATHKIQPVSQFWIITTENQNDFDKLKKWYENKKIDVKIFICENVDDFSSEEEIRKFRSFLFRIVLKASEIIANTGKLYLSLAGGRKNMSIDMHEACMLFGCDAMFHIIDIHSPVEQRKDDLLGEPGKYASYFLPIVFDENIRPNFIISAGERRICSDDFPIDIHSYKKYTEDGELEKEITCRKKQSSQIYANFYAGLKDSSKERDIFRKLYFLHPDILYLLKKTEIGKDRKRDIELIKTLPKADLHTHLGGILSAKEIIEVAKMHPNPNDKIKEILKFKDDSEAFDRHIFSKYIEYEHYHKININSYQKLGDYQGSALLQSEATITKAVEIYAQKLIEDHVKYVEIRCSPYKYTREGLSIDQVVEAIMNSMDQFQNKIEYRLICIIGRQDIKQINDSITELLSLINQNERFRERLAGIDLAGDESVNPPKELRDNFMPFLEECIHITIHAGETEDVSNIWQAVYHLSADRIGHGLKLLDEKKMIPRFIDKNIGIEMCPSSNRQIVGYGKTGDSEYPLKKYMEEGLKVTVNTDNCGISRTSVSNEFYEAARLCGGLSLWDCLVLIRNSLIVSFVDKATKLKLLHEYENEIFEWCNNRKFI